MFRPAIKNVRVNFDDNKPQAYFLVDKRTGDRVLYLNLPMSYDDDIYEAVALFADKKYLIEPRATKSASVTHINRITDCFKNVDLR